MGKFVHLHTHSHYSLLTALPKIPDLVARAKDLRMEALALTDNGNLYGAIEFYKECTAAGIKPIIGVDAYLAPRTRFDKTQDDRRASRLVLLAENEEGYRNLLRLVTASHLDGFYYHPRMDRELLHAHSKGLIAISPSLRGEFAQAARAGDLPRARLLAEEYRSIFGGDNVFLELTHHPGLDGHQSTMERLREVGGELGIPTLAAHDVAYLNPEDRRACDTLRSVMNHGPMEAGAFGEDEEDFSFVSEETMREYFKDDIASIERTAELSSRISLSLKLGSWVFPTVPIPRGSTYEGELRKLVYAGAARLGIPEERVRERVEYELSVINAKGFAPYFLAVADLLSFARANGILTTTRGSAAGSLVSYLSGITTVDPIAFELPFERFLNPERPKAPDIDMDFADDRRDEVIEYARKKYGEDHVAQIGTFGTMLARGVVRDVARALGFPYGLGDKIAREIPMGSQGFPMTLDRALEQSEELATLYKKEKDVREIIELGRKIEGCARHISVHAAGVVIAPEPLSNFTPLQRDPKGGKLITQYDMYAIEDVGLLKFDFLGIRNLSILARSVKLAKATRGADIDIERIPLDDEKTYGLLARGETEGLFQLGGSGMTRYLKELRPSSIHDINAMVALYRPGPMEMIPAYIERKRNPALISYLDPRMQNILNRSYGVITYQDDVLLIAVKLAGYSWLEADALRKAMGKKIPAEMEAQREKLIAGAIRNGMAKEKAEKLWKLIEPFAAYGFNKAHAASYGRVAYQTAYMKANFPVEYMAAVLSAEAGNMDTVSAVIGECKRMGIPVLPPDINESFGDFSVVVGETRDSIRFGLYSIKNFGEGVAAHIIAERKERGKFSSLSDFLRRVHDRNLNRKGLEALIQCGALDSFGERGTLLAGIERMLEYGRAHAVESSQDSLFAGLGGSDDLVLPHAPDIDQEQKLLWEKELLGLYVSGHPLDRFAEKLAKRTVDIAGLKRTLKPGMLGVVAGVLEEVKPVVTKNGEQMAFVKVADLGGSIEAVVFPKLYKERRALLLPERCVALKGRLSERNGELSIVVEAIKEL